MESGQVNAVKLLLQHMSRDSVLCANDQEVTPLQVAREKNLTEIVLILEKYANTVTPQMPCWESQMMQTQIPNYPMGVRNIESIIPGKSAARSGRKRKNEESVDNNLQNYNVESSAFPHQPSPPYQLVHSQSPHTSDSYCTPSPNETVLSNHNSTNSSSDSGSFASTPRSQENHMNCVYQDSATFQQSYVPHDFQNFNQQMFPSQQFYSYHQQGYNNCFNPYDPYQEMLSQRVPFGHQYYYHNPAQQLMYPAPMNPNLINGSGSNHTLNVRE